MRSGPSGETSVGVLLVDDHAMVRGLRTCWKTMPMRKLGEACDEWRWCVLEQQSCGAASKARGTRKDE